MGGYGVVGVRAGEGAKVVYALEFRFLSAVWFGDGGEVVGC